MARKGEALSAETKHKLSEAAKKRFKERPPLDRGETKRCSECGSSKKLGEFYRYKKALKSGGFAVYPSAHCKKCQRERQKRRLARLEAEGVDMAAFFRERYERADPDKRRERRREAAATRRREEGRKVVGSRIAKHGLGGRVKATETLAVEPIALLLETEMETYEMDQRIVSEATGISRRRVYAILAREAPNISLWAVDRVLTGLGLPHELPRLYPEIEA